MLAWAKGKVDAWATLPLGPVSRIQLIKIIISPKIQYPFWHSPIWVTQNFLKPLNDLLKCLLWGKISSRHTRDPPTATEGRRCSFPDMFLYLISAQLTQCRQ